MVHFNGPQKLLYKGTAMYFMKVWVLPNKTLDPSTLNCVSKIYTFVIIFDTHTHTQAGDMIPTGQAIWIKNSQGSLSMKYSRHQILQCWYCTFPVWACQWIWIPTRRVPMCVSARLLLPMVARWPLPGLGDWACYTRRIWVWIWLHSSRK